MAQRALRFGVGSSCARLASNAHQIYAIAVSFHIRQVVAFTENKEKNESEPTKSLDGGVPS